jgi:predicted protein tyrosine phosphatase
MPRIHVCPLSQVETVVRATGARALVTLINPEFPVARPAEIALERHLTLGIADIIEPAEGHVHPRETHVGQLIAFMRAWDRRAPVVVHCYAGISRSTAAAFIGACALAPHRREDDIARALRAASPTATPNSLLVAHADRLLGRDGRMIEAIRSIGRGIDGFEGIPFAMEIETPSRA